MENEIVYIVQCSSGEYEDYYKWIDGIYTTRDLAENRVKEIVEINEELLNSPEPYKDIDFGELPTHARGDGLGFKSLHSN